jgi:hypothetical protein
LIDYHDNCLMADAEINGHIEPLRGRGQPRRRVKQRGLVETLLKWLEDNQIRISSIHGLGRNG